MLVEAIHQTFLRIRQARRLEVNHEDVDADIKIGLEPSFDNVGMNLLPVRRVGGVDVVFEGRGDTSGSERVQKVIIFCWWVVSR